MKSGLSLTRFRWAPRLLIPLCCYTFQWIEYLCFVIFFLYLLVWITLVGVLLTRINAKLNALTPLFSGGMALKMVKHIHYTHWLLILDFSFKAHAGTRTYPFFKQNRKWAWVYGAEECHHIKTPIFFIYMG